MLVWNFSTHKILPYNTRWLVLFPLGKGCKRDRVSGYCSLILTQNFHEINKMFQKEADFQTPGSTTQQVTISLWTPRYSLKTKQIVHYCIWHLKNQVHWCFIFVVGMRSCVVVMETSLYLVRSYKCSYRFRLFVCIFYCMDKVSFNTSGFVSSCDGD